MFYVNCIIHELFVENLLLLVYPSYLSPDQYLGFYTLLHSICHFMIQVIFCNFVTNLKRNVVNYNKIQFIKSWNLFLFNFRIPHNPWPDLKYGYSDKLEMLLGYSNRKESKTLDINRTKLNQFKYKLITK